MFSKYVKKDLVAVLCVISVKPAICPQEKFAHLR